MLTDQDPDTTEITTPDSSPVTLTEDDAIGEDDAQDSESTELAVRQPTGVKPRDKQTGRWAQKKIERAKSHQELTRLRGEHESTLAQLQALQAERETWQQRAMQPAQQQQPAVRVDPVDRELTEINSALEAELALLERDVNRSPKRYNDLQDRKAEIRTLRLIAQANAGRQPQQQGPQVAPEYAARWEMVSSEYPWLRDASPRFETVRQQIKSYMRHLKEGMGRPDTIDTDREAITHVAAQNNINIRAPQARGAGAFASPASRGAGLERSGQRAVQVPGQLIGGSGLSKQQLAQAMLGDDE